MTKHDWIVLLSILVILGTLILFCIFAKEVLASDIPTWAKIGLLLR